MAITSGPGDDANYATGDAVEVTVTFDEAVTVDTTNGTPRIVVALSTRGSAGYRWAGYVSGSGTTALVFSYTVAAGDESVAAGILINANTLELNGGTILDGSDVAADLGHARVAPDAGHRVNFAYPTLVSAETSTDGATIVLTYDEDLFGTGTATVPISRYILEVDNAAAALKSGSVGVVSGRTVTLTPATPVMFGQTATLSYTDDAGDQSNVVVEDLARNDAPTFTDRAVTNNVAATDATLFGLALADGGTDVPLTPAFASGTFSYTASVAYSVSSVTVTATPNHGGASYELLNASNTAIDDADGNTPGDQVSLAEGVNTIKVEVTAADGSTTQTYTVTVTRQASDAPANLRATPGSEQVALSWDAPDSGSGVIRHEYRYKPVDGDYPATWTEISNSAVGEANEDGVTITGLDNGALYTFQVRAVDADGAGTPAETTDGPHPAVSIVAVNAGGDAIARIDVAEFRVTRTGSTSSAVDVSVTVTQDQSFLSDSLLSRTVTIAAGRSSERLLFFAGQFSSTVSADGTLIAVVVAGTGYVPAVPAAARMAIRVAEKPVQVLYGEDGYTVDEDIGTLEIELSAHVAYGLPKPDSNVEVALSTREHGLEGQRAARGEDYRVVSTTVTFRPADFRNKNKQGFWIARKNGVGAHRGRRPRRGGLRVVLPGVGRPSHHSSGSPSCLPERGGLLLGSVGGSNECVPSPRPHPRQRRSVVGAADGRAGGAADGRVQGPAGRA